MMRSPGGSPIVIKNPYEEPNQGKDNSNSMFFGHDHPRNHNARIAIPSVSTSVVLGASATRWTGP